MAWVGVISDTHGLLRVEALEALRGATRILHAGDVGDPGILDDLAELAPVAVVRGNVDRGEWATKLPLTEAVDVGGARAYMLHDVGALDLDPVAAGFALVVHGHSHRPEVRERRGVVYLNPGSAGPRRFKLPVSLARLTVADLRVRAELVTLEIR